MESVSMETVGASPIHFTCSLFEYQPFQFIVDNKFNLLNIAVTFIWWPLESFVPSLTGTLSLVCFSKDLAGLTQYWFYQDNSSRCWNDQLLRSPLYPGINCWFLPCTTNRCTILLEVLVLPERGTIAFIKAVCMVVRSCRAVWNRWW